MEDCNSSETQAKLKTLGKDKNRASFLEFWDYCYVTGHLLYLAGNSRTDIAFAVHHAARLSHELRNSMPFWSRKLFYTSIELQTGTLQCVPRMIGRLITMMILTIVANQALATFSLWLAASNVNFQAPNQSIHVHNDGWVCGSPYCYKRHTFFEAIC